MERNLKAIEYLESDEYIDGQLGSGLNMHVGPIYSFRETETCYADDEYCAEDHSDCPMDGYMVFRHDNEAFADGWLRRYIQIARRRQQEDEQESSCHSFRE